MGGSSGVVSACFHNSFSLGSVDPSTNHSFKVTLTHVPLCH